MALSDLNIVGFLKGKMQWHQAQQRVLAENVANADTPRYKPRELKNLSFQETLKKRETNSVPTTLTHQSHIKSQVFTGRGPFNSKSGEDFEVRPAGNAVVLEEQMMKVSKNQFDFQMASTLYSKSLGLIKTAIGRNA